MLELASLSRWGQGRVAAASGSSPPPPSSPSPRARPAGRAGAGRGRGLALAALVAGAAGAACGGGAAGAGTVDAGRAVDAGPVGDGRPAELQFEPPLLALPPIAPGEHVDDAVVIVTNAGGTPTRAGSKVMAAVGSPALRIASTDCGALPPGGRCTVHLAFAPTEAGLVTGSLVYAEPGGGAWFADLRAPAVAGRGLVATAPDLVFSWETVGHASMPQAVSITNDTREAVPPLVLAPVPAPFLLAGDGCSGAALSPAQTCTLSFQYRPTRSAGPRMAWRDDATVEVSAGALGSVAVTLSGIAQALLPQPNQLAFFSVPVGATSAAQAMAVVNGSDVPVGPCAVTVLQGDAREFQVDADTCTGATLAPGEACTLGWRFAPMTAAGGHALALAIGAGEQYGYAQVVGTTP